MKARKQARTNRIKNSNNTQSGPTDRDLAAAAAKIEEAGAVLGPSPIALTPAERQALAKPSAGAEKMMPKILDIARRKGIAIPGVDLDATEQRLAHAQRFEPLEAQAEILAAAVTDTVLSAKSEAWVRTTIIYGVLSQIARSDTKLQRELEPIRAFFSRKRAAKNEAQPAAEAGAPGKAANAA